MLLTYKYIDIPNYSAMIAEIRAALDIEDLLNTNMVFIQYDPQILIPKCPLLQNWLTTQNLNAIKTVIVRAVNNWHKINIHVDNCNAKTFDELKMSYVHDGVSQTRDILGLQLGIENLEETYTAMYRYIDGEIIKNDHIDRTNKPLERGYPSMRFEKCNMEEIARYYATRPVIFNATVPHTVVNNTGRPRLLLSLRFNPDPWHLVQ